MKKYNITALKSLFAFILILVAMVFILWTFMPRLTILSIKKQFNMNEIPEKLNNYGIDKDTAIMIIQKIRKDQIMLAIHEMETDTVFNMNQIEGFYNHFDLTENEKNLLREKIPAEQHQLIINKIRQHPALFKNMLPEIKKAVIREIESANEQNNNLYP